MKIIMRAKKNASAPRRPALSASQGMIRQPRMVAKETSITPREASWATCGPIRPEASASAVIADGTYTVPAHSHEMEASMKREFRIVRRRNSGENRVASGRQKAHE